jgi:hypothetical protein
VRVVQDPSRNASATSSEPRNGAGHNDDIGSRVTGKERMWVIYLNAAIAVAIVAVFVVWTMRGRK